MSDFYEKIGKLEQQILRKQQQISRLKDTERKTQTRLKIELGGLVFTAGMNAHLPDLHDRDGDARAIILGVLADATDKLETEQFRELMLKRGRQVFALRERARRRDAEHS